MLGGHVAPRSQGPRTAHASWAVSGPEEAVRSLLEGPETFLSRSMSHGGSARLAGDHDVQRITSVARGSTSGCRSAGLAMGMDCLAGWLSGGDPSTVPITSSRREAFEVDAVQRLCVGIITKNRRDDCLRAISSVHGQSVPCRVLLFDNGSTDGVAEAVLTKFPETEVIRHEENRGVTFGRNEVLARVDSDFCAFLDNDAELVNSDCLGRALSLMRAHPRVGVIGMTIVEHGRIHWGPSRTDAALPVRSFHGAGQLVRMQASREVGGYKPEIFAYNEESDLSLRMFDRGWLTVHVPDCKVIHHKNPNRDLDSRRRLRWRNELLFKWQHCPTEWLLPALAGQLVGMTRGHGVVGGVRGFLEGVWDAVRSISAFPREPVRRSAYRLWRRMGGREGPTLEEIETLLVASVSTRTGTD